MNSLKMPLVDLLVASVDRCLLLAEKKFKQEFSYQAIQINIRGKAAGQVRFDRSLANQKMPIFRFNPHMLNQYKESFIDQVVPHECAHLVVHQVYRSRTFKPHGVEWQKVMRELYHLEPRVTHQFKTISQKRESYLYQCACEDLVHRLSIIRHNKVMREQASYRCKRCSDALVFKGLKEI